MTFDVELRKLAPSALIPLLDLLDRHKIKCTFFILGRLADRSPEVPAEIISHDHEIACHGYAHDPYDKKPFNYVKTDIEKGTAAVSKICDVVGFRAPYFRPHRKLARILENLGYHYDSSVPSKRFDLFIGRTNNPYNLLAPATPYSPSRENIFQRGSSRILEIPLASFGLPLLGVVMRNMGLKLFITLKNFISTFSDLIMFDIHIWEFLEASDDPVKRQTIFFHRRRKGKETLQMFEAFLNYLEQKGKFVMLSTLAEDIRSTRRTL